MDSENIQNTTLNIKRGDSKTYIVSFEDESGVPLDITGWTVFFTVKESIDDSDDNAWIKKDITDHSDPTNGETTISLSSTDTNHVESGAVFDIQVKTDLAEIKTILEGFVNFTQDVTQRTS